MYVMGASMVKWIDLDPYVGSKKMIQNYTLTLNFVREIHRHSKSILICKAKQIMMTNTIPKKV